MTGNRRKSKGQKLKCALTENCKGVVPSVNCGFLLWVVKLLKVFSSAFLCIFQAAFNNLT